LPRSIAKTFKDEGIAKAIAKEIAEKLKKEINGN
jgi:hypothetical protein